MCEKHSFLLSAEGRIYHGFGVIESHSAIASYNKINEDKCNKYEYNPNKTDLWAYGITGLEIDTEVFIASKPQIDTLEKYIKTMFPTKEDFENYSKFAVTAEFLELLSKDGDCDVRSAVAENKNTNSSLLELLSKDEDWRVRYAVARNKNTNSSLLEILSKDEDCCVRYAVAENNNYKK